MVTINFQSFPAKLTARFECSSCGKKRTRVFKAECTVNPFNTNEDGSVKTPAQVRKQSQADVSRQVERFMTKPACSTCEGSLSYTERKALSSERNAAIEAKTGVPA